ncbi:unnamed protein product, partial [Ceratitis capitata]
MTTEIKRNRLGDHSCELKTLDAKFPYYNDRGGGVATYVEIGLPCGLNCISNGGDSFEYVFVVVYSASSNVK